MGLMVSMVAYIFFKRYIHAGWKGSCAFAGQFGIPSIRRVRDRAGGIMKSLMWLAAAAVMVGAMTIGGSSGQKNNRVTSIAAAYPGDSGIAKDRRVLFSDNFES